VNKYDVFLIILATTSLIINGIVAGLVSTNLNITLAVIFGILG